MDEYEPPEVVELGELSDVTQSGNGSLADDNWWTNENAWWANDEDGTSENAWWSDGDDGPKW